MRNEPQIMTVKNVTDYLSQDVKLAIPDSSTEGIQNAVRKVFDRIKEVGSPHFEAIAFRFSQDFLNDYVLNKVIALMKDPATSLSDFKTSTAQNHKLLGETAAEKMLIQLINSVPPHQKQTTEDNYMDYERIFKESTASKKYGSLSDLLITRLNYYLNIQESYRQKISTFQQLIDKCVDIKEDAIRPQTFFEESVFSPPETDPEAPPPVDRSKKPTTSNPEGQKPTKAERIAEKKAQNALAKAAKKAPKDQSSTYVHISTGEPENQAGKGRGPQ